jgi:hypothetical protein
VCLCVALVLRWCVGVLIVLSVDVLVCWCVALMCWREFVGVLLC